MGEISDEELHDVVEEVMLEEIQTLRVGLEDWKKVAQDWATENLATAKRLVEAEVEVERLRAEVAVQQAKIENMRLECVRVEAARDEAVLEANWRIENETRAAGERDKARAEVERLRPVIEAARAWGAVQCECATGELEPTATALAKALFALETL